jgi:hypothetical protein
MTKRTDAERARDLEKLRDLRIQRAQDVFKLVSDLPKTSSSGLGLAVPDWLGKDVQLSALSARELEWFTQNVDHLRLQESRAFGAHVADVAVTAQYRPSKLTVPHRPRYFLRPESTVKIADIYVFYRTSQAIHLPFTLVR